MKIKFCSALLYVTMGVALLLALHISDLFRLDQYVRIIASPSGRFADIYNITGVSFRNFTSCIQTSTLPKFFICPFDAKDDIYISNSLISTGVWEPFMTRLLRDVLLAIPNATFVDIGANIGYFTSLAVSLGHDVIAVEPIESNVHRLAKASFLNGFQDKITVIKNAVSNVRDTLPVLQSSNNQGAHRVLSSSEFIDGGHVTQARSIVLDDLTDFIGTRDVILKLDIEGHECRALDHSENLFKDFHVNYIFMEWSKMTKTRGKFGVACPAKNIRQTAEFLSSRGFKAYDLRRHEQLDISHSDRWMHDDIYWISEVAKEIT